MKLAAIKKLSAKKKSQTNLPVYGAVGYGFYHPVHVEEPKSGDSDSSGDGGGDGGGGGD